MIVVPYIYLKPKPKSSLKMLWYFALVCYSDIRVAIKILYSPIPGKFCIFLTTSDHFDKFETKPRINVFKQYNLAWFKPPMKVIDRTKAVTQHFLENSFRKLSIKKKMKNPKNTKIYVFLLSVASWCCKSFCVVPCVSFTGHFVMVPSNMTYLHCLRHSLFEHLFNLYYISPAHFLSASSIFVTATRLKRVWELKKCCARFRSLPLCIQS